jgi:hypothetical protein
MGHEKKKRKKKPDRTGLDQHKKVGSQLKPPFSKIENMSFSSWKDERMPEMLWAVLAIGNWERRDSLDFFRYVASFVKKYPNCHNVTLSGIGRLPTEDRERFIQYISEYPDAKNVLRPLLLFSDLPAHDNWGKVLDPPEPEADWNKVGVGVLETLDHQSQKATDCRWIKLLCEIYGGKMKFPRTMEDTIRAVFSYPDEGDLRQIRPFIRASEIGQTFDKEPSSWPDAFWNTSQLSTACIPLPPIEKETENAKVLDVDEVERVRMLLLEQFIKTINTTALDPRHYTVFGAAFYSLRLLNEVTVTNLFRGALSRIALRTLIEVFITLKYLTKQGDADLWLKYCDYGDAQAKLVSLKLDESGDVPSFINEQRVKELANQNKWEEFITIELGHWDKSDVRKLSIDADCKEIYDRYYPWTSGYVHGNLAAIQESVLRTCGNPVHRLHQIPSVGTLPLPSSLEDMVAIINLILDLVDTNYPDFKERVAVVDAPFEED